MCQSIWLSCKIVKIQIANSIVKTKSQVVELKLIRKAIVLLIIFYYYLRQSLNQFKMSYQKVMKGTQVNVTEHVYVHELMFSRSLSGMFEKCSGNRQRVVTKALNYYHLIVVAINLQLLLFVSKIEHWYQIKVFCKKCERGQVSVAIWEKKSKWSRIIL